MAFEKLVSFTKDVSDLADKPALGSAAALKAQFDAAPDEVRVYLNRLIDALKSTTTGDSGAKNIGFTTITGLEGADVQTIIEKLKEYVDNKANNGAVYGDMASIAIPAGFQILTAASWIKGINSDVYEASGTTNIVIKKSGLYQVNYSMTRSDLAANQYFEIGFAINNDSAKLTTNKMVMGQYGWNQTGGPNLSRVPLSLTHMVRVSANDYINFNIASEDGPRSYEKIKFSVVRISD